MERYVIPEFMEDKQDLLWLNLVAKEFTYQSAYARGNDSIDTGSRLCEWKILAPKEIQENVSHDWGEYESMATRITQKIGQIRTAVTEAKGIFNAVTTGINEIKDSSGGNKSFSAKSLMSNVAGAAAGTPVPKYRIDSSVVYKNSKRREYQLTFNLALFPKDKDPSQSIFKPIRDLEKFSCAEIQEDDLIGIKFPAVFKIYTSPSKIININHAALTAVQPNWKSPFKKGYPISCELTLSFMDIEPLYRKSFDEGGIIKTS